MTSYVLVHEFESKCVWALHSFLKISIPGKHRYKELWEHFWANLESFLCLYWPAGINFLPFFSLCIFLYIHLQYPISSTVSRHCQSPLVGFVTTLFLSCFFLLSLWTTEASFSSLLEAVLWKRDDRQTGEGGRRRDEWPHSQAQQTKHIHTDTTRHTVYYQSQ